MDKEWYKSMTFWGAFGFAISAAFEELAVIEPTLGTIAKSVTAALIAFGFRRALK
jgi:hypothetical protein